MKTSAAASMALEEEIGAEASALCSRLNTRSRRVAVVIVALEGVRVSYAGSVPDNLLSEEADKLSWGVDQYMRDVAQLGR